MKKGSGHWVVESYLYAFNYDKSPEYPEKPYNNQLMISVAGGGGGGGGEDPPQGL